MPFARAMPARCSSSNVANPPPLLVVGDRERDLGRVGCDTVVAGNGDDVAAELRDQDHVVDVVDRRDAFELHGRRPGYRREEPEVDRLVAQAFVQREERRLVVGAARPDPRRPAVGEHDVTFPAGGILEHACTLRQPNPAAD